MNKQLCFVTNYNFRKRINAIVLSGFLAVSLLSISGVANGQGVDRDWVNFTGRNDNTNSIQDFTIEPYGPGNNGVGGLGFSRRGEFFPIFSITDNAPAQSFTMAQNGLGIGIDGFNQFPAAMLHVVGGPFSSSHPNPVNWAIIQDTNNDAVNRNLLRLINGGPVQLSLENANTGKNYSLNSGFVGDFFIQDDINFTVPFYIGNGAPHNLLNLDPSGGVGINTSGNVNNAVAALLHVTADSTGGNMAQGNSPLIRAEALNNLPMMSRTMIDLRNNGRLGINLTDTSGGATVGYSISAEQQGSVSSMRFGQDFGNLRPNVSFFSDGHVRYSLNGKPNFTVKPNGDLNILGQAPGIPNGNGGTYGSGGNLLVGGFIDTNNSGNSRPGNLRVTGDATVLGTIFGTLSRSSDVNLKENFEAVNPRKVLAKVTKLPISTWNYKDDKEKVPHMGPMAQDFHKAFRLGNDETQIFGIDEAGVALAAIQGLDEIVKAKDKKITRLAEQNRLQQAQLREQADLIDEMMNRLEQLEAAVSQQK